MPKTPLDDGGKVAYDPTRHHRRSIRLRGYDYRLPGAYFVTLCVRDRACCFGEVAAGAVQHSPIGRVACAFWQNIPDHVPQVVLDAFVVMPNHVHGIIGIIDRGGAHDAGGAERPDHGGRTGEERRGANGRCRDVQLNVPTTNRGDTNANTGTDADADTYFSRLSPARGTLSVIVRTYKGAVTRWCRQNGYPDFAWQPRFYDHIIRHERALHHIRRYIAENPLRWHQDRMNPHQPE